MWLVGATLLHVAYACRMDDLQHVAKRDLLKRDLDTLTPQQQARAMVMLNKADAQTVYCRLVTSETWALIFEKIIERACNGHLKSADWLARFNGTMGIKPPEEQQAAQAPTVVYIDNAGRPESRTVVNEGGG